MTCHLTPEQKTELVQLVAQLVQIPSSSQDGEEIYRFVIQRLDSMGVQAHYQSAGSPYSLASPLRNLVARLGKGVASRDAQPMEESATSIDAGTTTVPRGKTTRKKSPRRPPGGTGPTSRPSPLGPRIMLNGHLDTVVHRGGWLRSPYSGHIEGDRLYGLGAADMKAGCAINMLIAGLLASSLNEIDGELLVTFVFGEEAPFSLGADALLGEYPLEGFDLVLVTEPSPILAVNDWCATHRKTHKNKPFPVAIVGAEGRELFEVEFLGKSAHASHPTLGINALHDAARFVAELANFDLHSSIQMGRGHYVVLNITGGDEIFTVPDHAKILVNRQLTLGEDAKTVTTELKRIIRVIEPHSTVRIGRRYSPGEELEYRPYMSGESEMLDRFFSLLPKGSRGGPCRMTTSSVGDFNLFATRTRVPTLVFGPGGGNIHAPNEWVSIPDVIATAEYLLQFFLEVYSH
ncbi:MAG: M20/M25/M40 family metallo-hydrolase [Bradymonadales bacterium]|nr:M20/M25/M40 family metallo-hydrolase [Bradymonadales bacterium]